MRTRNMILSGVFTLALLMLVTQVHASSIGSIGQQAAPGNIPPRIYLIKSSYDICEQAEATGGQRPDGFNLQDDGCLQLAGNLRFQEYAFTGEQLNWKVVVRDLNGAADISYAKFTVAGYEEALCVETSNTDGITTTNVPAWETAQAGFQAATDKIFTCTLTVEPQWYGTNSVNIAAYDQEQAVSTMSIAQTWYFNPAIKLDLSTNDYPANSEIVYQPGVPGQTVMSQNKLVVTNLAEGGVDLWTFIAADDLTDPSHSGALCPTSNVLDVEANMKYQCKIGTLEDDTWHPMANKDNTAGCDPTSCFEATPLIGSTLGPSIIQNGGSAECSFQLRYPVPCIGNFSQGLIHIIVKAL